MGSSADSGTEPGHWSLTPWTFHLYRKSPLSTSLTGVLLGAFLVSLVAVLEFASGRPQALLRGVPPIEVGCAYLPGDYRIGVVGIIALAFSMTARYKLTQWTHESTALLKRPQTLDAEALARKNVWGFLPGLIGIMICLGFAIDIGERDIQWTSDYWILPHIHNWAWCFPFGWVGGRLIYSVITNAVIVSRIAENITIERLDQRTPIDATLRHGLRSSLISLMFLGIISVHFIDPALNLFAIAFVIVLITVGALISALPVLGVAKSYEARRELELLHIREDIKEEERQLIEKDPDYAPGRIGDLVAMEQRLLNWNIRLIRVSSLARLALYVGIGFLSWLGAAALSIVVEDLFRN